MQQERKLLHFANILQSGIVIKNNILYEIAEEIFGYTTGSETVKQLNNFLFKRKAELDRQNYYAINSYKEGNEYTKIDINNSQNIDLVEMFTDCIDRNLDTNYKELYVSIIKDKELKSSDNDNKELIQDTEIERNKKGCFFQKSESEHGRQGKGTALSFNANENEVILMYRGNNKLAEWGRINQSVIKLDNYEIKSLLESTNAKVLLKIGKSPERTIQELNRNIDYEVYDMTGIRNMTDTSIGKYKYIDIAQMGGLKEETNRDVIKRILQSIDGVLRTDYVTLYDKIMEKIVDNRALLTPELEAQAWKDNAIYDQAEKIMQVVEKDSDAYHSSKKIRDIITGEDEREDR